MYAGVVVAYNPEKEVVNNISTYIQELDILYVIDNSNKNNESIFSDNKKIVYISNNKNLGIATALNQGAKLAIEAGHSWLLTMDQDSRFESGTINKMKAYITFSNNLNEQVGIITPFHRTKRNEFENRTGIEYPVVVMTSGNLVNLSAYKKIGGFIDEYFIDCVDFHFCMSIRLLKYQIVQINEVVLDHELGDILQRRFLWKTVFADNHNAVRRYYVVRNRHYVCEQFKNDFPGYCQAEIKCTRKEAVKIILFEKDKVNKLKAMYQGYKDYKNGIVGSFDERIKKYG